jgi:hypothetical protein
MLLEAAEDVNRLANSLSSNLLGLNKCTASGLLLERRVCCSLHSPPA